MLEWVGGRGGGILRDSDFVTENNMYLLHY